jgi:Amt family ammonium transporter
LPWCWWYDGHVTDGFFASKAVNSAVTDQGLYLVKLPFIHQLTAMIIVSIFASQHLIFFVVNKITPLRVSEDKEELGLDISARRVFITVFIKTYSKENLTLKKKKI